MALGFKIGVLPYRLTIVGEEASREHTRSLVEASLQTFKNMFGRHLNTLAKQGGFTLSATLDWTDETHGLLLVETNVPIQLDQIVSHGFGEKFRVKVEKVDGGNYILLFDPEAVPDAVQQ